MTSFPPPITSTSLMCPQVLPRLSALVHLDLSCMRHMDTDALRLIGPSCPHLLSLKLKNCRKFDDEALGLVATHCTGLQVLSLENCKKLTSTGPGVIKVGVFVV